VCAFQFRQCFARAQFGQCADALAWDWTKCLSARSTGDGKVNGPETMRAPGSAGMEQGPHFVVSNFAPSGYNRGVLTKAKTKPTMTMDLRDGPIRCGLPAERSGTIRFQAMSAIRDCRPNRKGGVAG